MKLGPSKAHAVAKFFDIPIWNIKEE